MGNTNVALISVIGGALSLLQVLVLFLLTDLRERIMRLETREMGSIRGEGD